MWGAMNNRSTRLILILVAIGLFFSEKLPTKHAPASVDNAQPEHHSTVEPSNPPKAEPPSSLPLSAEAKKSSSRKATAPKRIQQQQSDSGGPLPHPTPPPNDKAGERPTISAPGGVVSIDQRGGITARDITIAALPDISMSNEQEAQLKGLLGKDSLSGVRVVLELLQPTSTTREFAAGLKRVLDASGSTVRVEELSLYAPPIGITIHKGMSVISFPPDQLYAIHRIGMAIKDSKVMTVPIHVDQSKSPDIRIMINHSMDTWKEAFEQ